MKKIKEYLSKKEYIVFIIALIITISSFSYAFFISSDILGNNVATTECFKLSLEDSNDINLDKAHPISESEGSSLTPYTFTIKNVCNKVADYQVNIETLSSTTIDTEYIRIKLDNNESNILKRYELNESNINNNVKEGRKITSGTLRANEEKTYNIRMWIDEESTIEQSANKEYHGKITVIATPNKEVHDIEIAYIVDGVAQDAPPAKTDGYIVSNIECENATGTWDYTNWGLLTTNMIGRVTCDITFEEAQYNNVTKWLATANINKNYTTLSEVFNDTDTLSTLTNNETSCDYLDNSTDWINDVTSNENAMTYIGNNDYCADKLLGDNNWINTILDGEFYSKITKPLVPNMTSNTEPSGEAFASTSYASTYEPHRSFSDDFGIYQWMSASGKIPAYIGYDFINQKKVYLLSVTNKHATREFKDFTIQGSNDKDSWVELTNNLVNPLTNGITSKFKVSNIGSYRYYRLYITSGYEPQYGVVGGRLQFYGR